MATELGNLLAGFGNPNYKLLEGWDTTTTAADTAPTTTDALSPMDSPIPANTTLPAALQLSSPYKYQRSATSTPKGGMTVIFAVTEAEEVDTTEL